MSIKDELQNIISGNGEVRHGKIIQSISNYLRRKKKASSRLEKEKFLKKQEASFLINYAEENQFFFQDFDESQFIGEGAEQRVYQLYNSEFVVKLNDGVFYENWSDYFNSLLLHNYFFPHLAYEMIGFALFEERLHAAVKQPFIKSNELTDLRNVKKFLEANGFENSRNNDYYNPEMGIIIEDLHDENVLTKEGTLQFIDTVFYLTPQFYNKDPLQVSTFRK